MMLMRLYFCHLDISIHTIAMAVFLWLSLAINQASAQTPHEFFKFRYLEPPMENSAQSVNSSFKLDANTRPPELTTLEENFDPPVGAHKRIHIYDKITFDSELAIQPTTDAWERYYPMRPPSELFIVRKAMFYAPIRQGQLFILSTDSSDMRISDFRAYKDDIHVHDLVLWHSASSGIYAVTAPEAGTYRIELTTASPKKLLEEMTADELKSVVQMEQPRREDLQSIRTLVMRQKDIATFMTSKGGLAQLANWFRGFEATPLLPSNLTLLETILQQKRGICRHRSLAFVAIAQAFGYKTRMVTNEAHAFVEVFVNGEWRFVDLGGQTEKLNVTSPFDTVPVALKPASSMTTNIDEPRQAYFAFTSPPPKQFTRDVAMTIQGNIVDQMGKPVAHTLVTLGVDAPHLHSILASGMTDSDGNIQFVFRLPPAAEPGKASLWLLAEHWQIEF